MENSLLIYSICVQEYTTTVGWVVTHQLVGALALASYPGPERACMVHTDYARMHVFSPKIIGLVIKFWILLDTSVYNSLSVKRIIIIIIIW